MAVVLSAQCTDKKVNEVTQKLFKKYPTFNDYLAANLAEFEMEIRSTGFYRNKAKNILMTARIVADDFGGKIPSTMDELIKLPGVGRKTANVLLGALYGQAVGVVVDTHVKRLAIKFGLTNNTSPETIEKDLMAILPQEAWWEFAHKLKSYGQDYSPAHKKNEESDPISQALVAQV